MMNSNTTKTMRLPPRRLMTSPRPNNNNNNNKRKEREGLDDDDHHDDDEAAHQLSFTAKVPTPPHSKQLLAGYLAHEFLTKGTLFGQTWDNNPDPAAANAIAMPSSSCYYYYSLTTTEAQEKRQAQAELHHHKNYQSYVEVANLLKHSGSHLQGIVNPTQLARLLNL
ncbi:uncharacterized protein E6C27_scaffold122G001610 [Cucumis melo var. makuwa]|uniref:Uncharacterized protein n=1 Tax=Cucumis melo var. makuwa TaxID=1194695 RepID=A0A5A7T8V2_CUCMM|nr:uncharacterized protein E6C27_scaffold122G001610 [Cucumis melo var. makuwa]